MSILKKNYVKHCVWKKEEKELFYELFQKYDGDYEAILSELKTKTLKQVKNFVKCKIHLFREKVKNLVTKLT